MNPNTNRKTGLLARAVLCLPIACASAAGSAADGYPSRPVRIIVPQAAGGTADTVARTLAPGLSALFGQQMVIDNRGGAGGIIGTELAAKAVPDGYTISLNGSGPLTVLPNIQKQVPYDPIRDFVPVSLITISPFALVAHPSVAAKTVKELVALARANPGKLNYASAGSGSVIFLGMELLKSMTGISIVHVPYKGSAQGLIDVLGGHVALMLFAVPPVVQHVKAERLRLLAVTSAKRSPQLPDVPTISEAGLPGYDITTWTGLFVPLKTSPQIVARLRDGVIKTIRAPETLPQFQVQGMDLVGSSPEEFAAFIRTDLARNAGIIKAAGGKPE